MNRRHHRSWRVRTSGIAVGVAVLGLTVAACGSPGPAATDDEAEDAAAEAGDDSPDSGSEEASGASTDITDEPVTLRLADYQAAGTGEAMDELVARFEELYPNVDVERSFQSFPDYQKAIKLQLAADSAPDVVQVGQGHTMQAPLVAADLLRPIDDYVELYGWDELYPGVLSDQNRVEDGGRTFGTGNQYAVDLGGNVVGVFYNKTLTEQLGLTEPPETLAEFEEQLATAKAAGMQPIVMGDLGGGPASHTSGALFAVHAEPETIRDWIFGQPGADITDPSLVEALEVYQRWWDEGYINGDASGTAYQDAATRFIEGESVFQIGGNWLQPAIDEALGENGGFFLLPPVNAGDPPRAPGAGAGPFGISAASENPDVAAAFIDFMVNGEQAELLATQGGFLPFAGYDPEPTGNSLDDIVAEWTRLNEADGLGLYLDWATPSMGPEAYFTGLQELAAGRAAPEDVLSSMQANWTEFYG